MDHSFMPRSWPFWILCLLLGGGVAAGVALAPPAGHPNPPHQSVDWSNPLEPAYVGNNTCAQCHAGQFADWETSGHSHTFFYQGLCGRYASLVGREVTDPERGGLFRFNCDNGEFKVSYTK